MKEEHQMKIKTAILAIISIFTFSACNIVYDTPETLTETLLSEDTAIETTAEETTAETTAPSETTIASETIQAISPQTERQNSSNDSSSNNGSSDITPENAPAVTEATTAETVTTLATTAATTTVATTTTAATTTASETIATTVTTTVTTTATSTAPETSEETTETTKPIPPDGAVSNYEVTLPIGIGGAYTGNIKDGLPEGQGKIVYSDGGYIEGTYKNGVGNGTMTEYFFVDPNDDFTMPGTYWVKISEQVDGKWVGKCEVHLTLSDGTKRFEYLNWAQSGDHFLGDFEGDPTTTRHIKEIHPNGSIEEYDDVFVNGQWTEQINYTRTDP
jgi:hypothetical protein